jgi:tetratricopeptide (TPR) repeat protein
LGRLDEAAAAYEECVKLNEESKDERSAAIAKLQLGTVRLEQGRYSEALSAYEEARKTFESLGEPRTVATVLHQMGIVHRRTRQYEQAERAYRESLAIEVQQQNLEGEADSIGELGVLYDVMGRVEEAVRCHRQSADIWVRLQNQRKEGMARYNLAYTLLGLGRHDEARTELLRAIECDAPYGHVVEPWKTWNILNRLETDTGNAEAAARARRRAFESYLSYRRAGGYGRTTAAKLCAAAAEAIAAGDTSEIEQDLSQPLGEDTTSWARAMFPKVLAVLRGERDPALADDPALDYDDAVELTLLLEAVAKR